VARSALGAEDALALCGQSPTERLSARPANPALNRVGGHEGLELLVARLVTLAGELTPVGTRRHLDTPRSIWYPFATQCPKRRAQTRGGAARVGVR
jgi:hypothetical protein